MKALLRSPGLWIGLLFAAALWAVAYALRQTIIEPSAASLACGSDAPPWWCPVRQAILVGQSDELWGIAAFVAGLLAVLRGGWWAAALAAGLSLTAIVNYNVEMGALALVLALLAFVRQGGPTAARGTAPQA